MEKIARESLTEEEKEKRHNKSLSMEQKKKLSEYRTKWLFNI